MEEIDQQTAQFGVQGSRFWVASWSSATGTQKLKRAMLDLHTLLDIFYSMLCRTTMASAMPSMPLRKVDP
jgi:hypothetical protein